MLAHEAEQVLCEELPELAVRVLRFASISQGECTKFVHCVDNQEHIRGELSKRGLVAFLADGSVLPRESGATDRPMSSDDAVALRSPSLLRVSFEVPHEVSGPDGSTHTLHGLGIPEGVTLVVGGGYHGKSTLLRALQRGVYPHIPGDGREYVVTRWDAVKIRAEDGRRVENVDIHAFIDRLPHGRGTTDFRSEDASGSTSQAANILRPVR